jgi:hypothetical protein
MQREDERAFLNALPPAEHLATFDWLTQGLTGINRVGSGERSYYRSRLLEAAGRVDEALAGYRALQTEYRDRPGSLLDRTREAIHRLTSK